MNNVMFFEIQAQEPEKALEFYKQIFGWEFRRQEGLSVPYWDIKTEGINGGLLQRPAKTPPLEYGTNAYECSMEVDDFDKCADKIIAAGGQIALPKFAVPGRCWQGYFLDVDHNTFGIFQVDLEAK